jgi:tetratricopeptide (TPR) repeat protein
MDQLTIQHAFELAVQHHEAGRTGEAEPLYRAVLAKDPQHVDALYCLGVIAHHTGRRDEAIDLMSRVVSLDADYAEAHNNLGILLKERGQWDQAIAAFERAVAAVPDYAEAYQNLCVTLRTRGRLDEAIATCRAWLAVSPGSVDAYNFLGIAMREVGRPDEAIAAYRQVAALSPQVPVAHNNLGVVLKDNGYFDEAIAAYRAAIALRPDYTEAYSNLGNVLRNVRRLDEAVSAHRQAIALGPDAALAHFNLGITLLAQGNFKDGWAEYEWRLRDAAYPQRNFHQPRWNGEALDGRTLLIHAETGFGDSIQFIRYLPLAAGRGGNVIVECQPELRRVFQSIPAQFQIITRGQPLPAFDLHCPLFSLPFVFKTTLESIPRDVPYLFADSDSLVSWRDRLALPTTGLKIALNWAGNPAFRGDRLRSLSLDVLAPLANVCGVTFYSIQKGGAHRQVDNPPAGLRLIDLSPQINDFADTAAVISLADLVITTDTSVAHLAGALGRPVWIMLQYVADWRWLLDRQDSPWYPSMRLFRQPGKGDWSSVIDCVAAALAQRSRQAE